MSDYIMTIGSDVEDVAPTSDSKGLRQEDDAKLQVDPEFVFDVSGDPYVDFSAKAIDVEDIVMTGTKPQPISVDEIIARRRLKRKRDTESQSESEDEGDLEETTETNDSDFEDDKEGVDLGDEHISLINDSDDGSSEEEETREQKDRKAAFFESASKPEVHESFLTMNLSRPVIKALTTLGFSKPTPIQAAAVPVALLGKDVVGNAVTGSGKTAAFLIPMLERLLYREKSKKAAATRCVVLVPTRELGIQCFDVGTKLAVHTDIRLALIVGGFSLKSQEASLRSRPDIVIATPGRLIDHIRNSPSFNLDAVDILVLDEADRMLEDGFADELSEIIKSCPTSRQTMLFSATMTDSVDSLVKMSLNKPVKLFVDPKRSVAGGLVQEFVRVRAGRENERSALLVSLCKRTFKHKVIVFLRSKKLAHQMRIVFGLLEMKCEELHGDLTQEQRLKALRAFREGDVDYLMATDLASRGLDIKGVETIINYDMPPHLSQYLHRVGRTARAGRRGRSVTLVGEADRKILKAAIKHSSGEDKIRHRIIPAEVVQTWFEKIEGLNCEIADILTEEKEERQMRKAEMELKKGENMVEHEEEIFARPARTWFQTAHEKQKSKDLGKQQHANRKEIREPIDGEKPRRDKLSGLTRKQKRRKLALEADKELGDTKSLSAAIRSAKKLNQPQKIGMLEQRSSLRKKNGTGKKPRGVFEKELGRKAKTRERARPRKPTAVGSRKKSR